MPIDPSAFLAGRSLLDALSDIAARVPCADEVILFEQHESPSGVYLLQSGRALLTMADREGAPVMETEAGPGSLLGLPAVAGNQPYSLTAIALKGARVDFVAQDKFGALMLTRPDLAVQVLQVLAAEVRAARTMLPVH